MKKVAIFVEGMTEQEFVVSLITALVGSKGLHVVLGRQWQGKVLITPSVPLGDINFYILVVDCSNDDQVKTQIKEQYPTLMSNGYTAVIGLRDVYPFASADIPQIQAALSTGLPNGAVTPQLHLAVMEVEAWFLGETSHFARLHASLSVQFIVDSGFDIARQLGDSWDHPAEVLDNIYKLANFRYMSSKGQKRKNRVQRTIRALSFQELHTTVRQQLPALDGFLVSLERALF